MLARASHAAHRTPGIGSPTALARSVVAAARTRTDGGQGLRRVDADVPVLVRERLDERGYRRTGPLAQSAQRTCGIARNFRILVSQCPSQRRLNRCGLGRQVNQGICGVAPEGGPFMPKQFNEQRHGRRTDPPDDFKRPQFQVFVVTVEESPQQWQRTPRPLDQGGFGGGPDLRVAWPSRDLPTRAWFARVPGIGSRQSSVQMSRCRMVQSPPDGGPAP